jgi:uncharacterized protein (DUF58 family)
VAAIMLAEIDLVRVGALLLVLPLLARCYVRRTTNALHGTRLVDRSRVSQGEQVRVSLHLHNGARRRSGPALVEDRLPYALGSRPRFVLDPVRPGHSVTVAYDLRADVRGRHRVGPLVMRARDPFGLARAVRTLTVAETITVLPRVLALPQVRFAGDIGSGTRQLGSGAIPGTDDTATREYRDGDDLRRVHWRSTARTGELMVRREEQPRVNRATIALDCRGDAHHGEGATSSLEWAITAAASISVHLDAAGYDVQLITGSDAATESRGGSGAVLVLHRLAEIGPRRGNDSAVLVERLRHCPDAGLFIAIMGRLPAHRAATLAATRRPHTAAVALLLNTGTWVGQPGTGDDGSPGAGAALLAAAGWRVAVVNQHDQLPLVWSALAIRTADPAVDLGATGYAATGTA